MKIFKIQSIFPMYQILHICDMFSSFLKNQQSTQYAYTSYFINFFFSAFRKVSEWRTFAGRRQHCSQIQIFEFSPCISILRCGRYVICRTSVDAGCLTRMHVLPTIADLASNSTAPMELALTLSFTLDSRRIVASTATHYVTAFGR